MNQADLPAVGALGAEIQRRLEQDRVDGASDEAPFEVRALECMVNGRGYLRQTVSITNQALRWSTARAGVCCLRGYAPDVVGAGAKHIGQCEVERFEDSRCSACDSAFTQDNSRFSVT